MPVSQFWNWKRKIQLQKNHNWEIVYDLEQSLRFQVKWFKSYMYNELRILIFIYLDVGNFDLADFALMQKWPKI